MTTTLAHTIQFSHVTLQGSAYEVGRQQGLAVASVPGWLGFVASARGALPVEVFNQTWAMFDRFCPGINEEIQGLADGAGVAPQDVIYYLTSFLRTGHCCHLVALPHVTANGHMLAARSYEFSHQSDDLRLCTTRITGKYAHVGGSVMLLGRSEGLNEHGLSVTSSAGGMPVGPTRPPIQTGFQFWVIVRSLLENCQTVDEALAVLQDFPVACNCILLLADPSGQAAKVEIYGPQLAVERIAPGQGPAWLGATNHYVLPEMQGIEPGNMHNSVVRLGRLQNFLACNTPELSAELIKAFLAQPYPHGPCCHYYDEYFGTLRSYVFDLTSGTLNVCFGSPAANVWHSLDLNGPAQPVFYPVSLPLERMPAGFMQLV